MGLRGPKPVDVARLREEATRWATLLYALRDGQPPQILGVKKKQGTISKLELLMLWARSATSSKAKASRDELMEKIKTKDWVWDVSPPVTAAPTIWEQLKSARSVRDIRGISREIHRWVLEYLSDDDWATRAPDLLASHADTVISAKRLANYPRTDRARSDNKRIEFFSKVLAGIGLDIAPITAAKRLSGWHSGADREAVQLYLKRTSGEKP